MNGLTKGEHNKLRLLRDMVRDGKLVDAKQVAVRWINANRDRAVRRRMAAATVPFLFSA